MQFALYPKIKAENNEDRENCNHLQPVLLGLNPEFLKEIDATENFHGRPEYDDRGYRHTYVCSPRGDAQLAAQHQEGTYQADQTDKKRHGMVVAEEVLVITEHQ